MTTSITWPASLPLPQRSNFGYQNPELNQRTEFALGARVRPLFGDGADTFDLAVVLTAPEWALFQAWYRTAIANGSSWFLLPLLAAGDLDTREVRFTSGALRYALVGVNHVSVTMTLETRAGTAPDADVYDALIPFPDLNTLGADLQSLEDYVNTETA